MQNQRIKRMTMVVLATIAIVIAVVAINSGKLEGAGTLETSISPFYPRHQIRFDAVHLNSNGRREFRFRGAPTAEMDFIFSLAGASRQLDVIDHSTSIIDVELLETEPRLRRHCKAVGRPSNTEYAARWVVGGPADHPDSLWHSNCLKVSLKADAAYLLRISIHTDSEKEVVTLVPMLEGGGIKIES